MTDSSELLRTDAALQLPDRPARQARRLAIADDIKASTLDRAIVHHAWLHDETGLPK